MECGLFESRAKARAAIEAGGVTADGAPVHKASEQIDEAAALSALPAHPWVSRAGVKLAHALDHWPLHVAGRTVLDVGASTGGFTQVALTHGAARVFAVDVGHGQLHASLRADPRVVCLEGVDARLLTTAEVASPPQLIVCDASFISLSKVLPAALELAAPAADLICLVKPQFEVGPGKVGKGGVVRDPEAREAALRDVMAWLASVGWKVHGVTESPITGSDGNIEFLVWAHRAAAK